MILNICKMSSSFSLENFLNWPLFSFYHLFYIIQLTDRFLPMLGFELRISGVGSHLCHNHCPSLGSQIWVSLKLGLRPSAVHTSEEIQMFASMDVNCYNRTELLEMGIYYTPLFTQPSFIKQLPD